MNKPNIENEQNNIPSKKTFFTKIKELGNKIKHNLRAHFPKRIWSKPQENKKGQKF